MSRRPPTLEEAAGRGLLAEHGKGVHTFSNGSEWDSWASPNCHACKYWNKDVAGDDCAFEAAAFLQIASPELARMFGWLEEADYGWRAPQQCSYFAAKSDGDDDDRPAPPPVDPTQLVLIADPSEDASLIRAEREPAPTPRYAQLVTSRSAPLGSPLSTEDGNGK